MKKLSDISLISPSRNNGKYLKWSYASVRKNIGPDVEYCVADDFSDKDDTWEWCLEMMKNDPNFKAIRNEGPVRLGHTIYYDELINNVSTKPIVGIWHADMYMPPNALDCVLKELDENTIVSLTRCEPLLHPSGKEKIQLDLGVEPDEFKEEEFLKASEKFREKYKGQVVKGFFAPWFIYKHKFQEIGGHDELFYPQSREDSDISSRFLLNGMKFKQLWETPVYHLTCRGSRRNPTLTNVQKDSDEWVEHNRRSERNFIRKWGHFIRHDEYVMPIIPHKYDIGFEVVMDVQPIVGYQLLKALEPWCSNINILCNDNTFIKNYINEEQENTKFDLSQRVLYNGELNNEVCVLFKATDFMIEQQSNFQFIQQLPDILNDSGDTGEMEYNCFTLKIKNLNTYEKDLIKCENTGWRRKNHK